MPKTEKKINKIKNGAIWQAKSMKWIGEEYPYLDDKEENETDNQDSNQENKTDNQNSSQENTNDNNNNESSNSSTIEDEYTISIDDLSNSNLSFNEIKKEIENRGLKVYEDKKIEQVPYTDDLAGTEQINVPTGDLYKKGETVYISRTIYKGQPVTAEFFVGFTFIYDYDDIRCTLDENGNTTGIKVYFDDKLVATLHYNERFEYTFENQKSVRVKLVAPYAFVGKDLPAKKNLVIKEYNLNIKDIRSNSDLYNTYS